MLSCCQSRSDSIPQSSSLHAAPKGASEFRELTASLSDALIRSAARITRYLDTKHERFSNLLELHPKHPKQIQPQNVHEMPVLCSRSERTLPQDGATEFAHNVNQSTQTAQHVQGVYCSEDIEK